MPIVGDKAYTGLNKAVDSPRIFLHAHMVGLEHPTTGEELDLQIAAAVRPHRGPRFRPLYGGRVGP